MTSCWDSLAVSCFLKQRQRTLCEVLFRANPWWLSSLLPNLYVNKNCSWRRSTNHPKPSDVNVLLKPVLSSALAFDEEVRFRLGPWSFFGCCSGRVEGSREECLWSENGKHHSFKEAFVHPAVLNWALGESGKLWNLHCGRIPNEKTEAGLASRAGQGRPWVSPSLAWLW